jgi:hypothetical protein
MTTADKLNFDPKLWGPSLWFSIHLISLRYPMKPTAADKKNYGDYFRTLRFVLPCDGCCKGFEKILEITKFGAKDLANRNTLFAWTVKAHALVNAKTGKAPRDDPEFWMKQYLALAL